MHWLTRQRRTSQSRQAEGTDDTEKVNKMRSILVDFFGRRGSVRADGRVTYDISLCQVKSSSESKVAWDYMKSLSMSAKVMRSAPSPKASVRL